MLHSGNDAREVIREVFVGAVDEIARDGKRLACLIVSATVERARDHLRVAERLRSTTRSLESALFDVLAEGQLRGQIPADHSATDLATFLVTSLQGLRVMGGINADWATLMRSAEVALSCLDRRIYRSLCQSPLEQRYEHGTVGLRADPRSLARRMVLAAGRRTTPRGGAPSDRPTLPGLGDGDDPAGLRLQDSADYVVSEVERLQLTDVILVGHSWAGYPIAGAVPAWRTGFPRSFTTAPRFQCGADRWWTTTRRRQSSMTQWLPNSATISGSFGSIHVPPFFHGARRFEVRTLNGRTEDPYFTAELIEAETAHGPLAYQALHVAERIAEGETESDVMSPRDTVATLRILETIREAGRSRNTSAP